MQTNFVSISAISNKDQLVEINRISQAEQFPYSLAIGYQISNKSINQRTQNPRQPRFSKLGELDKATRDYSLITAVHYYTNDNRTIIEDLEKVVGLGVEPSQALLQFNTLPPSPDILKNVREMGYNL